MFESLLKGRLEEREKVEEKKLALVSDPLKLDEYAGKVFQQLSPSGKMASEKKAAFRTERVDAKIPDDHPLKGFGEEFKTVLQSELASPKNRGYSVQDISTGVVRGMLNAKDEKGMSRLERAHHAKYMEDNSLLFGEDFKATLALPGMATYGEWAKQRKQAEIEADEKNEVSMSVFLRDLAISGAAGAGIGALYGALGAGPIGAGAGALYGGLAGIGGEIGARPFRHMLMRTDAVRSNLNSDSWVDKTQGILMAATPDVLVGGGLEGVLRGGAIARMAARQAVATPSAANVVKAATAAKVAQKAVVKDPVTAAKAVVAGVEPEGTVALGHKMLKVSRAMIEEADPTLQKELVYTLSQKLRKIENQADAVAAVKHPDGPATGITRALEKQEAEKYASGEIKSGSKAELIKKKALQLKLNKETETALMKQAVRMNSKLDIAGGGGSIEEAKALQAALASEGKELVTTGTVKRVGAEAGVKASKTVTELKGPLPKGETKTDIHEVFDFVGREDLKRKRKFNVKIETVTPGEPIKVGPIWHDAAVRHVAVRNAEGKLVDSTFGTYDTAINDGVAMAKGGTLPPGHTLYVMDIGPGDVRSIKIFKSGDITTEITTAAKESLEASPVANKVLDAVSQPVSTDVKTLTNTASDEAAAVTETSKLVRVNSDVMKRTGNKATPPPDEVKAVAAVDEVIHGRPSDVINYYGEEGLTSAEAAVKGTNWVVDEAKYNAKEIVQQSGKRTIGEVYNAIGDMHDRMLQKYFPGIDLEPATEAGLVKLTKQINQLPKKMSRRENSVLDSLIDVHDEMIEGVSRGKVVATADSSPAQKQVALDQELAPINSMEEFIDQGRAIAGMHQSGVATETVVSNYERLKRQVELATKVTDFEKNEMLDTLGAVLFQLKSKQGLIGFFAAFGVGASVFDMFLPQEAEAGVIGSVAKAVLSEADEAAMAVFQGMRSSGHIVADVVEKEQFHLAAEGFQKGLGNTAAGGASMVLREGSKIVKRPDLPLLMKLMGSYQKLNYLLDMGKGKMNNPAVHMASYVSAEMRNIRNQLVVFKNMFEEAGVKAASREAVKAFKPLVPYQRSQVGFDYFTEQIPKLQKQLAKLSKGKQTDEIIGDIKSTKQALAIAHANIKKFEPEMKQFHKQYDEIAQEAAAQHPSIKAFFAADDTPDFQKYPWLKNMEFTDKEKLLIGRYKMQMDVNAGRLQAEGIDTISGPYVHYALHPDASANMMKDITGNAGAAPYMKNYSRTLNARPLVPDIWAATKFYVPDMERRLQTQAFWKAGWKKVYNKLSIFPEVKNAFDQLINGKRPFDNSWGNKSALMYSNAETFNRLFLNPSAGLKHIVKVTGDMATLGPMNVLRAVPSTLKGMSYRIMDFNPTVKKTLESVGIKGASKEYDVMRKSAFNSIVPTMDTHYRVSQMGYDIPKTFWDRVNMAFSKVNNVGSVWINLAELFDRGISFEAAMRMATKAGMTVDQSMYGIYDTILKNNFLGREFTPEWLKRPMVSAAFLFQKTPWKIMERRAVNAVKANTVIKNLGKDIYNATKTAEGRAGLVTDLRNMYKYVKQGEREIKSNLIIDALRSEVDFFGTPIVQQFARDLIIMGAGTMGGYGVGVNLWHHFFHLPMVKAGTPSGYGAEMPAFALSPALTAAYQTSIRYTSRDDEDETLVGDYMRRWLGPGGMIRLAPDMVWKLKRMGDDDIPEIYGDSKFKYLFALPASETE